MTPSEIELSERECEILRLVATGASNKQIAQQLVISTNTVKVHLRNIFSKIEVNSRTEATLYAIRVGLVSSPGGGEAVPGSAVEVGVPDAAVIAQDIVHQPSPNKFQMRVIVFLSVALLLVITAAGFSIRQFSILTGQPGSQPTMVRWETRAAMLSGRAEFACAVYNGEIYAISGQGSTGLSPIVERYSPLNNAWTKLKDKPTSVMGIQAGVIGGRIIVPGGVGSSGKPLDILEIYDTMTDQWQTGTPIPEAVSAYALAVLDGKVYLFGGWDGEKALNKVYMYDPDTDHWQLKTSMPTARASAGAAISGGKIYIIGGYDGKKALTINEVYTPELDNLGSDPWETGKPLPIGRYGLGASSLADVIYVNGGKDTQGNVVSTPLQFNPDNRSWSNLDMPPSAVGYGAGQIVIGDYIFTIGGQSGVKFLTTNQVYRAVYTIFVPVAR
jgi:DNA-binding CsgD family transcriptional regulator